MVHRTFIILYSDLQTIRVENLCLDVEQGVGDAGEAGAEGVDVALGGGQRVVHLDESNGESGQRRQIDDLN